MSGFFGCVSKRDCVADVFYGTDYHSHLGTKRGGMAFYDGKDFVRTIHSLENAYFRNKFEDDLPRFEGSRQGIGIISDMESQPITLTSHLGRFSLVAIGRIDNLEELTRELLGRRLNFAELSASRINPTELVATLVSLGDSFREGIELVQSKVKGSCSMLILTPEGIYASRDKYGRTPVVVGRGGDGYAIATESSAFANLDYRVETELKPAQTLFITADGHTRDHAGGQAQADMFVHVGLLRLPFVVLRGRERRGCPLSLRLRAGLPRRGRARCRFGGRRARLGRRSCDRLFQQSSPALQTGIRQVYADMAPQFHAPEPENARSGSEDEAAPERSFHPRFPHGVARRLDRARHPAQGQYRQADRGGAPGRCISESPVRR